MKITITYPELEEIIRSKAGQKISVSYVREDVARIVCELTTKLPVIGEISKSISADVRYVGIDGDKLNVQLVDSFAIPSVLAPAVGKIKDGLLSLGQDNNITVNLDKIENMDKVLSTIRLNALAFLPNGVEVDLTIR